MMRKIRFLAANISYVLLGATVAVSAAQPSGCAPLVAQALSAVDSNCADLGRNSVCYGYNRVDAAFFDTVDEGFFSTPADRAELAQLASIQTAPLDVENDQWGVAMMNVQANVPNTLPGQAVTFVLLGDARVENAVPPVAALVVGDPVRVVVTAGSRINIRSGPGTNFNVVANADPGQLFDVDARSEAGDWFRISGPTPFQWISRSLFAAQTGGSGQLNELPVARDEPLSPMQAFYFRTGIGAPVCAEAPDLLLVQGPQNVRVSLSVNGAEVALGSTVAFKSGETSLGNLKTEDRMNGLFDGFNGSDESTCLFTEMSVLEGDALANGGDLFVPLGHWSKSATCLDENRAPVFNTAFGMPSEMTDEEMAEFAIVEEMPMPHYDVHLPTRDEIQESVNNGPGEKPEPTRLPRIQITVPTRQPTQPGGSDQPRPSDTPDPSQPDPNAASCEGFSITGPGGSVNAFSQSFSWTFARNVAGYQLEIIPVFASPGRGAAPQPRLYRVGGEINSINVKITSDFGTSLSHIDWKVQVLVRDGQGNLVTLCESPYVRSRVEFES